MNKKEAQFTSFDKDLNDKHDKGQQIALPFEYDMRSDIERSHHEKYKKDNAPKKPMSLVYPEINPEMLKYRGLPEEKLQELKKYDEDRYKDHQSQYWTKDLPFVPPNQKLYELNKMLPDEAKKTVIDEYNKFKAAAKEFQSKYNEANLFASKNVELNYEGSYIDLFKNFSKFVVAATVKEIGKLFGVYVDNGRSNSSRARNLARFINTGINIFNINPLNIKQKLHEMQSATQLMSDISVEYDRRKKVLNKLPAMELAVKRFLLKKDVREFLKWMDEYFTNDKEDFMSSAVSELLNIKYHNDFSISDLEKIKTYKSIWEKALNATTTSLLTKIKVKTYTEINERLRNEVSERVKPKLSELTSFIENIKHDNLDDLVKYIYKNFKLDLRSVFNFIFTTAKGDSSDERNADEIAKEKLFEFKKEFLEDLKESTNSFKNGNVYTFDDRLNVCVNDFIKKYVKNSTDFDFKKLSIATEKEINDIVNNFFKNIIMKDLPGFSGNIAYYGGSKFQGLRQVLMETGKLTVESTLNLVHGKMQFVPKEFLLNLIRQIFKGNLFNGNGLFKDIVFTNNPLPMKIYLDILKRSNKFNPNSFTNEFTNFNSVTIAVNGFIQETEIKLSDEEGVQLFSNIFRNTDTIDRDANNMNSLASFIHNNAGNLNKADVFKIIRNKNFKQYNKIGIVKKLFTSYAKIKNMGGLKGIYTKYGNVVDQMRQSGFVSKKFDTNVRFIIRTFNSGEEISPASPSFKKLFDITSATETDLEAIEMSEALQGMLENYDKKDERLFNLNVELNNRLKFKVLKDKDPRMLRVGIESGCCQRIGGVGEIAARDSFVNPLAGVLILEWKNDEGQYVLLSQSYFHYVPTKNTYILDNVETNSGNLSNSGVDIAAAYAYLAQVVKDKFNITNFLAGKGYSKIEPSNFKTFELRGGDPRSFSSKALTKDKRSFYTDFSPSDAIDLLSPKFKMEKRLPKLLQEGQDIKKAFKFILPALIKIALVA